MKQDIVRGNNITENFRQLGEIFPNATWDDYDFTTLDETNKVIIRTYNEVKGIFISTVELNSNFDLKLHEDSKKTSEGVIRFFNKSIVFDNQNNEVSFDNIDSNYLFITTNEAPLTTIFKKNQTFKVVNIRFDMDVFMKNPRYNSQNTMNYLKSTDFWMVQQFLSPEIMNKINNIFEDQLSPKGRIAHTLSNSLEILFNALDYISQYGENGNVSVLPKSRASRIQNIQLELIKSINTNKTIADIGKKYGITTKTLLHDFKLAYGSAPMRWILDYRLNKAKQLLLNTDMPLIDIALELGFTDSSHFTNSFKKKFKITPLKVRKQ